MNTKPWVISWCSKRHSEMFKELRVLWLASRVHYISIEHTASIVHMLHRVTCMMHAAISHEFKPACACCFTFLSCISTWECSPVQEAFGCVSCFHMHFSHVLKNSRMFIQCMHSGSSTTSLINRLCTSICVFRLQWKINKCSSEIN